MTRRRVDIREAAEILDTTVDAVRKRVQRGTLESEREDGRVYVWLDTGQDPGGMVESSALISAKEEQIEQLREQIDYLKSVVNRRDEEIQRRDVIISQLTQRIPELPASPAQGAPDAREGAAPDVRGEDRPAREGTQTATEDRHEEPRGFWRRLFGG